MTRWIRWSCLLVVLAGLIPVVAQEAEPEAAPPPAETAAPAAGESPAPAPAESAAAGADEEVTTGEAFLLKLRQGGWTIVFLLALSVFGVAFAVERFVHLRRGVIVPPGLAEEADRLWRAGDKQKLLSRVKEDNSTLARMIEVIVEHRRGGPQHVSNLAGDVAARDLKRHLQRAYSLAVVSTVAPLLGLLGTVIGMIGAFDKVAAAGSLGDASVLGGDISKALITTGAGLAVAIPALILYHYFKSRTNMFGILLEEEGSDLITGWFGDDYAAPVRPKKQVAAAQREGAEPRPVPVAEPEAVPHKARPAAPRPATAGKEAPRAD